jgi:hypothetical protein
MKKFSVLLFLIIPLVLQAQIPEGFWRPVNFKSTGELTYYSKIDSNRIRYGVISVRNDSFALFNEENKQNISFSSAVKKEGKDGLSIKLRSVEYYIKYYLLNDTLLLKGMPDYYATLKDSLYLDYRLKKSEQPSIFVIVEQQWNYAGGLEYFSKVFNESVVNADKRTIKTMQQKGKITFNMMMNELGEVERFIFPENLDTDTKNFIYTRLTPLLTKQPDKPFPVKAARLQGKNTMCILKVIMDLSLLGRNNKEIIKIEDCW